MNPTLEEKKTRLAQVRSLLSAPAYAAILVPHFESLALHHAAQCRNKRLTAEKRAEHIEAAELAEQLTSYLEKRAASLEAQIEAIHRCARS
jgi:hypothetical protein